MIALLFERLYTQEELQSKVARYQARYEQSQNKKDFRSMASLCYDTGCLYELLGEEEKSRYYYQQTSTGGTHCRELEYRWSLFSQEIPCNISNQGSLIHTYTAAAR